MFPASTRLIVPFLIHWYVNDEPVAVTENVAVVPALFVRLTGWLVITGGEADGVTMTRKLFVAIIGGFPLSVTIVVMVFVLGAWASVGVQLMTPAVEIVAPAGATRSA
jgi:hypothetical protein